MDGKKNVTSVEEVLAQAGLNKTPSSQTKTEEKSFSSVEDVLAAAEEARKKERKNFKTFASTLNAQAKQNAKARRRAQGKWSSQATQDTPVSQSMPKAAEAPSEIIDLMDDFDHAIEAAMAAKKSAPDNLLAAQTLAVSLILKKQVMSRSDAEELVPRAFKYLEK